MVSKHNFVMKACAIWNFFINDILSKSTINNHVGYIIPGEEENSDLWASISFVKENLTKCLLKLQSKGCKETWEDDQFQISIYKWYDFIDFEYIIKNQISLLYKLPVRLLSILATPTWKSTLSYIIVMYIATWSSNNQSLVY